MSKDEIGTIYVFPVYSTAIESTLRIPPKINIEAFQKFQMRMENTAFENLQDIIKYGKPLKSYTKEQLERKLNAKR